jgi:hypothetical protein
MRNKYAYSVGKHEKKMPLERHRCRLKNSFKEIGREDVDWFHLARHRVQGCALVNTE